MATCLDRHTPTRNCLDPMADRSLSAAVVEDAAEVSSLVQLDTGLASTAAAVFVV